MRLKSNPLKIVKHTVLIVSSIVFMFPFLWMVFGVFKTNNEIWQQPYKIFPAHWNLAEVLRSLPTLGLGTYIYNSFFVGIVGTFVMLLAATLFTYVIVFMKTKHTELLFALVLATYMLPGAITYVPSYVILANVGLLDSLSGLIVSNMASVFAVFYLRQSFKKTSLDYIDAARIDGANHLRTLWHVVFPLNQSAFFTLFTLTFIQQYNNYMWPSIMLTSQDKYLISQGLRQFFIQEGAYGMNWAEVMLASTVATLPLFIIFIVGQNWLVTGIMQDSGLK
jgi:multiple sugar transport system permease protein